MVRSARNTKGQQKKAKNESESPILEEKADSMGAKIEDDTQAKKEEIEAEPPEKKVKVSNQNDAGDAKELKHRRSSYKRLGISEDEAEKLLRSEDANEGRRTRSRSRGGATESPRAAKKAAPAKESPVKRGRKAKKAAPAPVPAAEEEEEEEEEEAAAEEPAEKAEEPEKEAKEEPAAVDGEEPAAKEDDEEDEDEDAAAEDGEEAAKDDEKEESEEKAADGDAKTE